MHQRSGKKKKRLDELLQEKGVAADKKEAFVIVTEGRVFVNGQKAVSPGQEVGFDARVELRPGREYVGRGAYKLEAALKNFDISVRGKICADIGSATGGFVEILLKYGAKKVYAIDTARGKFDSRLRGDPRVVLREDTDARDVVLPVGEIGVVTADVSLISLRQIIPVAAQWLNTGGDLVVLFKPQYEVEDRFLRHGVVQDGIVRQNASDEFIAWAKERGWEVKHSMESPIRGASGNVEYLIHLYRRML